MIILSMIRPLNVLISIISVCISAFILNQLNFDLKLFHTIIVVTGFTSFSNLINDIFDIKTDKINRPDGLLVSGKIIPQTMFYIACAFLIISFIALTHLNTYSKHFVVFIILPIIITYTPIFKSIPLIGNILIGITLASVFIFSELSLTGQIKILWIPALLATHLTILRELMKDIEDYEGDYVSDIITFPVCFGIQYSIKLFLILTILLLGWGGFLPFFIEVNSYYSPIFWIIFSPWIFLTIYFLFWGKSENYKKISNLLKIATVCGLAVILTFGF